MPAKKKKVTKTVTTAQKLGSVVKSARDIMRKDKGLNGELDRLPQLTWIMFLKLLDDAEKLREDEAELAGKSYKAAIKAPYRWRDWAANENFTGDRLKNFINNDEADLPDGKKGLGLLAYLGSLKSKTGRDRPDVISKVFKDVNNRMISGTLLFDVLSKINEIHFNKSEEVNILSLLYESMLKEMRDSAGDSGEFYTPRAVIRFMVEVIAPKLGETILDPACGTGGFLVEVYEYLKKQTTASDWQILQQSIIGGEAKSLPLMLAHMNLLLHGFEYPYIDSGNSLRHKLSEMGVKDRVDIILTNPPFGGEEEDRVKNNFPSDKQTQETALLFLQLIMRKLNRGTKKRSGRAAMIVPKGILKNLGVAEKVRFDLISKFNLHTIVQLPKGVFEPYADIPTCILFFDTSHKSKFVWFYEHPLPVNRRNLKTPSYSKSQPLVYDEFKPLLNWWTKRVENQVSWKINKQDIINNNCILDILNPNLFNKLPVKSLTNILSEVRKDTDKVSQILNKFNDNLINNNILIDKIEQYDNWEESNIESLCDVIKGKFPTLKTSPGKYNFVVTAAERKTANQYQFDTEAVCVPMVSSTGHGHASLKRIHYEKGKFALANIMVALIVKKNANIIPKYLYYYLYRFKDEKIVTLMSGTANTSLNMTKVKSIKIKYPKDIEFQNEIVNLLDLRTSYINDASKLFASLLQKSQEIDIMNLSQIFDISLM